MAKKDKPLPGTRGSDTPHPVDVHVGQRIKLRRTLVGMTQGQLGESIGLTFQQVQKYERGFNRVSASKLWLLSNILDVQISYFFDEMPEATKQTFPGYETDNSESDVPEEELTLHRRQTLELVRAFSQVTDQNVRTQLNKMVKAMAGITDEE
ncbi:Uncharacterized HTH-type transcriptional regulator Smed_0045 [Candidatus Terasakiella magnetica]|uniref:Uncharacterized HTH-type transcriptional regulator Smed_0045 n=1 Tax=Candidatus Terasakiella magnetica TaxID=1867952 RepID=A0A1C3RFC5_9PROT|nr:helix-turn-helix transcriptional regulator [Candidatus Terasakiella magnetica]SCA55914.1 Uncharacterized HTH-type transcriptional regulator Smed_0045 [Candidatus Terasakiella magnetica]